MTTKKKSTKKKSVKKSKVKKEEETLQPTATSPASFTWSDEDPELEPKPAKQKPRGLGVAMYGIQITDPTDRVLDAAKSSGVTIEILSNLAFAVSRKVEGIEIRTRDQLTVEDNTKLRAFAEASGVKFKPQWVFVVP